MSVRYSVRRLESTLADAIWAHICVYVWAYPCGRTSSTIFKLNVSHTSFSVAATRLVARKIIELAQRGVRDVATLRTMTLSEFKYE
jgi:hypothetical protein